MLTKRYQKSRGVYQCLFLAISVYLMSISVFLGMQFAWELPSGSPNQCHMQCNCPVGAPEADYVRPHDSAFRLGTALQGRRNRGLRDLKAILWLGTTQQEAWKHALCDLRTIRFV